MTQKLTAIIEKENDGYVSLCPELDIASQGDTVEQARDNLKEALELHLDCLPSGELQEIKKRQGTRFTTTVEIPVSTG